MRSLLRTALIHLLVLSAPAVAHDVQAQNVLGGSLPLVYVLSTGGTIASTYDSVAGGFRPALSGEEIVRAVPGLTSVARVVIENVASIGSADPTYTGRGKGVNLKELGCIFSDNLSPQKARILLMLAMTPTKDPAELQAYFDR